MSRFENFLLKTFSVNNFHSKMIQRYIVIALCYLKLFHLILPQLSNTVTTQFIRYFNKMKEYSNKHYMWLMKKRHIGYSFKINCDIIKKLNVNFINNLKAHLTFWRDYQILYMTISYQTFLNYRNETISSFKIKDLRNIWFWQTDIKYDERVRCANEIKRGLHEFCQNLSKIKLLVRSG